MLEKVDETREWLDQKVEEQSALTPMDDPVFTVSEVEARMKKVTALAKKVFAKKKPKEPKKKKEEEKKEESADDDQQKKEEGEEDVINMDDEQFDSKDEAEKQEQE